jgi:DNA-binding CsgD family transcriptional regulator
MLFSAPELRLTSSCGMFMPHLRYAIDICFQNHAIIRGTFAGRSIMSFEQQTEQVLDLLYASPGDTRAWNQFLKAFAEMTASSAVSHVLFDSSNHLYTLNTSAGVTPEVGRSYADYYASIDEWYLRARGRVRAGNVLNGRSLCSVDELVKTEFYNDFLRPHGWIHECAAVLETPTAAVSAITMMRTSRLPDYTERDLEIMRGFVPHIQRALTLHRRFVDLRTYSDSTTWALDQLPFGVALLRHDGTLLAANAASERLCNGDGLSLKGNTLSATGPASHELQHLLSHSWHASLWPPAPEKVAIRRRDGSPLVVTVGRVPASLQNTFERTIAVFIHDPASQRICSEDVLQKLYGLTPAECRLALFLAEGIGIPDAAGRLGIAVATARSQLKSIFQKTSTKKQSQLARLIAGLSAAG